MWSGNIALVIESDPIPALAGPGAAVLRLPLIRSYGYKSRSSLASIHTCFQPSSGILVQYAG